jgi:NADH dehydrogenase
VANVIRGRAERRPAGPPFWDWDKGDLAIVGRTYAVADLRFVRFAGFPAWLVWAGVHIHFLIGFTNRLFVLLQWGFAFLIKRRPGMRIFGTTAFRDKEGRSCRGTPHSCWWGPSRNGRDLNEIAD